MEGQMKILHVDDDESFLDMASRLINKSSEDVKTFPVSNPRNVLDKLEEEEIDCVVSDYDMPYINGLELLEKVRDNYPDMPFIILTGEGSEKLASKSISKGVTDYVQKRDFTQNRDVTLRRIKNSVERRKAEKALRESEEKYRTLVEQGHNAVFIYRGDEVLFVNQRVSEIMGYSEEELLDMEPLEIMHPDERGRIKEYIKKRMMGMDVPESYVAKIITKDREARYGEFEMSSITYNGERAFLGSVRDVTESQRREQKILDIQEATRELFKQDTVEAVAKSAVETARDVLEFPFVGLNLEKEGVLEPIHVTEEVNEIFEEGPPSYPRSSDVWEVFESGESLMLDNLDESEKIEKDTPVKSGLLVPLGDHGLFVMSSLQEEAFSDEDRQMAELFCLAVTAALERAKFEQELKTERDRLAVLFNNIPDPAVFLDEEEEEEAIVIDVNPAFEEVFGYSKEEVVGESLDEFIVPEDKKEEARNINRKTVVNEEYIESEVRRLTDRGERDFLLRSAVAGDSDLGYAIYTDITEQKEREREINRQKKRLEKFASVLSHDIRNPLNIAQGYIDIARESNGDEGIEEIENAHERIEEIIDSMLELAREGHSVTEKEKVSLGDISEEAWSMVDSRNADIVIEDDTDLWADKSRLLRVFENIFRNAVDHGGDDVTVKVGMHEDGFYIENDGEPIPENKSGKIFEYGYSEEGGTGFGLAIVESIVEAHGWDIKLEGSDIGPRFLVDINS